MTELQIRNNPCTMSLLENKKIVIIGGTTGIGFSAAKAFILHGARVVVVGRDANNSKLAKKKLGKMSDALTGDAILPETAVNAINHCIKKFGGFDGLYHVA